MNHRRITEMAARIVVCVALSVFVAGCGQSCDTAATCPVVVPPRAESPDEEIVDAAFAHEIHLVADGESREIDLPDVPLGDGDMARIGRLSRLEVLKLPKATISDVGLSHLAGLSELNTLVLGKTLDH